MTKLVFLLVTLSSIAYVSAIFSTSIQVRPPSAEGSESMTSLSQWIVDTVSNKVVSLARFFNLKLRNLIEEGVKFGNFALTFLPQSAEDPLYWWVPAVSEFISISVGNLGGEPLQEAASERSEVVTNPPIFFNVPPSSTEKTSTVSNEDFDARDKRLAMIEDRSADPGSGEIDETLSTEDILSQDEQNILTLTRLINAGRDI